MLKATTSLFTGLLYLICQNLSFSQCPAGLYQFTSQEQVDKFPSDCKDLPSSLFIIGRDIVDLHPLKNIRSINGLVQINDTGVENLRGLENLASVTQDIQIINNSQLEDLDALSTLSKPLSNLLISGNKALKHIQMPRLRSVDGDVDINQNPSLKMVDLSDLTSATSLIFSANDSLELIKPMVIGELKGKLELENLRSLLSVTSFMNLKKVGSLEIEYLPLLVEIPGLNNLETSTSNITIHNNSSLKNLNGLNRVRSAAGIYITDNNALTELGSWALDTMSGDLSIRNNSHLTTLNGIGKFKSVKNFSIGNNYLLSDFRGLETLVSIRENASISGNFHLTSFNGLQNLKKVSGALDIRENASLTQLKFLEGLSGAGRLSIEGNLRLSALDGLDNLTMVDELLVRENASLTNLTALKNLLSANIITLERNQNLIKLNGFSKLTKTRQLFINQNAIQNLEGFEALKTVDEIFWVSENPQLTSLKGLENLQKIGINFSISRNKSLSSVAHLKGIIYARSVSIHSSPALTSLAGTEQMIVDGTFQISETGLKTLSGFPKGDSLTNLYLISNPLLEDLRGLSAIRTISRTMQISRNDKIKSLAGLERLVSVDGVLTLSGNPLLTDIGAIADVVILGQTTDGTAGLVITYNPLLTECSIKSVCQFINVRFARVEENGVGCENTTAIKSKCGNVSTVTQLSAVQQGADILITWDATGSEMERSFEIQSRTSDDEWALIGEKPKFLYKQNAVYEYLHTEPGEGLRYYRIITRNEDNTTQMSDSISINFKKPEIILGVDVGKNRGTYLFPNPVNRFFTIETPLHFSAIDLYSDRGILMQSFKPDTRKIFAHTLLPGTYFLKLSAKNGETITTRVVIGF